MLQYEPSLTLDIFWDQILGLLKIFINQKTTFYPLDPPVYVVSNVFTQLGSESSHFSPVLYKMDVSKQGTHGIGYTEGDDNDFFIFGIDGKVKLKHTFSGLSTAYFSNSGDFAVVTCKQSKKGSSVVYCL